MIVEQSDTGKPTDQLCPTFSGDADAPIEIHGAPAVAVDAPGPDDPCAIVVRTDVAVGVGQQRLGRLLRDVEGVLEGGVLDRDRSARSPRPRRPDRPPRSSQTARSRRIGRTKIRRKARTQRRQYKLQSSTTAYSSPEHTPRYPPRTRSYRRAAASDSAGSPFDLAAECRETTWRSPGRCVHRTRRPNRPTRRRGPNVSSARLTFALQAAPTSPPAPG